MASPFTAQPLSASVVSAPLGLRLNLLSPAQATRAGDLQAGVRGPTQDCN